MTRLDPSRVGLQVATLGLAALVTLGAARGEELVRLVDWEEPGVVASNSGRGLPLIEIVARTEWRPGATGRFRTRVEGPDGQVETYAIPRSQAPGGPRLAVFVRASAVRNLRPDRVFARVQVIDEATQTPVSNVLTATIVDFPRPKVVGAATDPGPFGRGEPLAGPAGKARPLPDPGPDDLRFVRIPASKEAPAYFLAATEVSNAQVERRLPGYDPRAGRADDFLLEGRAQPALGLTPKQAVAYLAGLGKADDSGIVYRLPTRAEWLHAARAGRDTPFWWGDAPTHPDGANFLGPEPALEKDTTAPVQPESEGTGFAANPFGLYHTFGNIAEWATNPAGGFVKLGGHFRTEPASPLPEVAVEKDDTTGEDDDSFVGLRPAFRLDAEAGADLVRKALALEPKLAPVRVAFDPERATATLTGAVGDATVRREADRLLEPLWFLAAVENRIETPTLATGHLAALGAVAGPPRLIRPLGHKVYEVPVAVRWGDPLPVAGSEWWVNVYLPDGGHFAHRLIEGQPDGSRNVTVALDQARMVAVGLAVNAPVTVALSLGAEAPTASDPRVVTNLATLRWSPR